MKNQEKRKKEWKKTFNNIWIKKWKKFFRKEKLLMNDFMTLLVIFF